MSERIEALPWDSEFFDLSIGRVELDGATDADLTAIETEAYDRGFDCVYGSLVTSDDVTNVGIRIQSHDFLLSDLSTMLDRPAIPITRVPTSAVARAATEDDLATIVETVIPIIAPWSRFAADPRFGLEASTRMWIAEVKRGLRDDHRLITITEDDIGITGFSTQSSPGEFGLPGYESVTATKPGSGAAHALIHYFLDWVNASETKTTAGWMAVRNIPPSRALEKHGYMLTRSRGSYHWWREGSSYA
ncbi:MAG: hypothetical protein DHS20C19_14390 [Acidimicrobiales bacterium]|nr:MAG: hypothetical protein DHS20C19_14390 [Acidimicrobiales bacterium]